MEHGAPPPNVDDKVHQVVTDYVARRSALVKALTVEADEFYGQCDPHVGSALQLFGDSNGKWSLEVPTEDLPPENWKRISLCSSGYNSVRDTMPKTEWLLLVAHNSESWIQTFALLLGIHLGLGKSILRPYRLIDQLPPVWQVVLDYYK